MSSTMGSKKSSKSLPKLKVPSRKQYASSNDQSKVRKLEKRVPKVKLNLVDNICSKLRKDGSWCTEFESKDDSMTLLHHQQIQEKLTKDYESLNNRHAILLDLAKAKVEQLDRLEEERRQLLRVVRKNKSN